VIAMVVAMVIPSIGLHRPSHQRRRRRENEYFD
jgi:hypothetical protein